MSASNSARSTPKRRRCATRSSIDTTSICATSRKCGGGAASSRRGCWISLQRRWPRIPRSRTLPAGSPTPEKDVGRSKPRSTPPCRCPCFRPRSTNVSARAARRSSPTSSFPPCATNSAVTWRKRQAERDIYVEIGRRNGGHRVKIEVYPDDNVVARKAAAIVADTARAAVAARGRFVMAVSGGHTPWVMLRALAGEDLPWKGVYVVQTDERLAPAGDPDR